MSIEALAICLNHSTASGTEKLILLGIANHDGDGGAYPSIATLARYANCSERTAQRCIKALVALGELQVARNGGGSANQRLDRRPNLYHILVRCPDSCDRSAQHRMDEVTSLAERGDNSGSDEVTCVSPEPSIEPYQEPVNLPAAKIDGDGISAADVVASYIDTFKQLYDMPPPTRNIGRLARDARELLVDVQGELVMQAAQNCAESGHANLSASVTWLKAQQNKSGQNYLRLAMMDFAD